MTLSGKLNSGPRDGGHWVSVGYLTMTITLPQRAPHNAPGDFYVEAGLCMRCCLVHGEAPDLMNDSGQPFEECFFRRQPQTPQELEQVIRAMCVTEVCALRYGGTDQSILWQLRSRGLAARCDHLPERRSYIDRVLHLLSPKHGT